MRTISLDDGKYEFDIDEKFDQVVAARHHGVSWRPGLELRYTNCFVVALLRIAELEDEVKRLVGDE
jgi:hypothetical protein